MEVTDVIAMCSCVSQLCKVKCDKSSSKCLEAISKLKLGDEEGYLKSCGESVLTCMDDGTNNEKSKSYVV